MSNQFKVSKLWAQRLQEHHISLPAVLRRAGLPAGFFQQEKIYVTTAELFALWSAVGEMSGDPAIGLKLGAEARLERYDPAAIAAVCSRSFRDAGNASPSTNSSAARRKSAFALAATKHPWNSRLSKLKETNLKCWSIYACPGFFPSATEARMATLNRYELNSYVPPDTANC